MLKTSVTITYVDNLFAPVRLLVLGRLGFVSSMYTFLPRSCIFGEYHTCLVTHVSGTLLWCHALIQLINQCRPKHLTLRQSFGDFFICGSKILETSSVAQ